MKSPEPQPSDRPAGKTEARTAREQRLAQALRDNLRRRKSGPTPSPASKTED